MTQYMKLIIRYNWTDFNNPAQTQYWLASPSIVSYNTVEMLAAADEFRDAIQPAVLQLVHVGYKEVSTILESTLTGLQVESKTNAGAVGFRTGSAAAPQTTHSIKFVRRDNRAKSSTRGYSPIAQADIVGNGDATTSNILLRTQELGTALSTPVTLTLSGDVWTFVNVRMGSIAPKVPQEHTSIIGAQWQRFGTQNHRKLAAQS